MRRTRVVTIFIMGVFVFLMLSIPGALVHANEFQEPEPPGELPETSSGPDEREAVYNNGENIPEEIQGEFIPESVLGSDDRIRVDPTTAYPFRYIVKLYSEVSEGSWAGCTGFFIGPHTILTAGHCLYVGAGTDDGYWVSAIQIYPALDEETMPYGSITVYNGSYTTYVDYMENGNDNLDIGWITLPDDSLGLRTGWFTFDYYDNAELNNLVAYMGGYPGDLISTAMYYSQGLLHSAGDISIGSNMMDYDMDSYHGMSGGPVWKWDWETGERTVFGVHTNGWYNNANSPCYPGYNCGTRIVDWMATTFESLTGATRGVECFALDARPYAPYTGSVSAVPSKSSGCPDSSYLPGTYVTVSATPALDFTWAGWSGHASGTSTSVIIEMTTDKSVIGNFLDTSAAPEPIYPNPTVFSSEPEFKWNVSEGARQYNVVIYGPTEASDYVVDEWIIAEDYCDSTSCTYYAPELLNLGVHAWWVKGYTMGHSTSWSSQSDFTIYGPPAMYTPSGETSDTIPTFSWQHYTGADQYRLYISIAGGDNLYDNTMNAGILCSGSTCSTSPIVLSPGSYRWWVKAYNETGSTEWSDPKDFQVIAIPEKVDLYAPSGKILDKYPLFEWEQDPGATEYRVYLSDQSGNIYNQWISESSWCSGGTCEYYTGLTLEDGNYTWWIQTRNDSEDGPWSDPETFRVSGPEPIAPSGRINDVRPEYSFEEDIAVDMYRLYISHAATGTVVNKWYYGSDVTCVSDTCSIQPDEHLRTGNHSWRVQSGDSFSDYRYWYSFEGQTYLTFKLLNDSPPSDTIEVIGPNGGEVVNDAPVYLWNEVDRASWYKVFIGSQDTGKVYNAYHRAADVCYGTQCEITPAEYWISGVPFDHLAYDTIHNWYVMPVNVAGNGSWSAPQNFRTEEGP